MPEVTKPVKRRSIRKQVQMAVTIVIESDEAEYATTADDLSPFGMRTQSDAPLAPGQPVGLLLGTDPGCLVKARVVWVAKAETSDASQVGFEFLDPLTRPVC
jgi:hypothetical protein